MSTSTVRFFIAEVRYSTPHRDTGGSSVQRGPAPIRAVVEPGDGDDADQCALDLGSAPVGVRPGAGQGINGDRA